MEPINIERINPENQKEIDRYAAGVCRVVNAIVAEGGDMALPQNMTSEQVAALVTELGERGGVFYAEERDKVVAFAFLRPVAEATERAILGVWVLPEHRRRGLGMELSRVGIEFARDAGYKSLEGTIPADNAPALSFFSAVGPIAAVEGGGMQYELPV